MAAPRSSGEHRVPRAGVHGAWGRSLALALGMSVLFPGLAAFASDPANDPATARSERAILMERFIVAATRINANPWRYASVPGFEILSRASDHDTDWWLKAQQSGLLLENDVLPGEWLPEAPTPYTLIVDDTDLSTVRPEEVHLPPVKFSSPADAVSWGPMSDSISTSIDRFRANDADTFAMNANLHGVDTRAPAYGSISRERLVRCAPPLPGWLVVGLLGMHCGVFRESFAPSMEDYYEIGHFGQERAIGPGALWVSIEETDRLLAQFGSGGRSKGPPFHIPPLKDLFAETPPSAGNLLQWESEAALFVRWALVGPGRQNPFVAHSFSELVRRARLAPVTESVFTDCFGFGYAEMERRLDAFLREVLAKPTMVYVKFPEHLPEASLAEATSDQIGRILGDWLRMQGDSLRRTDPDLSRRVLREAGRVLERAYRDDNGLPPDVDPSPGTGPSSEATRNTAPGPAVAMKPVVVSAARIHDPMLLAVYGLYEHDIGSDGPARELLEAAARAGAVRPTAYLVLAELRYAEAVGQPLGQEGKISARQAASVLAPLDSVFGRQPALDAYRLFIDAWAHCDTRPGDQDVARIREGVALFPRSTDLAYRAALLLIQAAHETQASGLIDSALVFATRESERARLVQLRSRIGNPTAVKGP